MVLDAFMPTLDSHIPDLIRAVAAFWPVASLLRLLDATGCSNNTFNLVIEFS